MSKKKLSRKEKAFIKKLPPVDVSGGSVNVGKLLDEIGTHGQGRTLIEQELSNHLTSSLFEKEKLYARRGNEFELALNDLRCDQTDKKVIVLPETIVKEAISTIINLDSENDVLKVELSGFKGSRFHEAIKQHNKKRRKVGLPPVNLGSKRFYTALKPFRKSTQKKKIKRTKRGK